MAAGTTNYTTVLNDRQSDRNRSISIAPIKPNIVVVVDSSTTKSSSNKRNHNHQSDMINSRMQDLIDQVAVNEQRMQLIEHELIVVKKQKIAAECDADTLRSQQTILRSQSAELASVLGTLEAGVIHLQTRNRELEIENERINKINQQAEHIGNAALQEQIDFLNARNTTLVKKCESLCAENRKITASRDALTDQLSTMRNEHESLLLELKSKSNQIQILTSHGRVQNEQIDAMRNDRADMERRLNANVRMYAEDQNELEDQRKQLINERAELKQIESTTTTVDVEQSRISVAELNAFRDTFDTMQRHYERRLAEITDAYKSLNQKFEDSIFGSNSAS